MRLFRRSQRQRILVMQATQHRIRENDNTVPQSGSGTRILGGHSTYQRPQFCWNRRSIRFALEPPEQSPSRAVPAHDRSRTHDYDCVVPIEQTAEKREVDPCYSINAPRLAPRSMYWASCFRRTKFSARIAEDERKRSRTSLKASASSAATIRTCQTMQSSCHYPTDATRVTHQLRLTRIFAHHRHGTHAESLPQVLFEYLGSTGS